MRYEEALSQWDMSLALQSGQIGLALAGIAIGAGVLAVMSILSNGYDEFTEKGNPGKTIVLPGLISLGSLFMLMWLLAT